MIAKMVASQFPLPFLSIVMEAGSVHERFLFLEPGETVRLQYVLNMLVIACCETTLKTTQTISYHSQKTSAILR
jgi:hypothetical protein